MLCVSLATPGTEACDAVGCALRPKWREWPAWWSRRVLSERVAFCMLLGDVCITADLPETRAVYTVIPIANALALFYDCFFTRPVHIETARAKENLCRKDLEPFETTHKPTGAYIMRAGSSYAHVHVMGRP
jgi:hypothetical protein